MRSVHIFTTAQDNWLLEGVRCALQMCGVQVQVIGVGSVGALLNHVVGGSNTLPAGSLLLPVFPENQMLTCFRSLTFLSEWRALQHGLFRMRAPCLLWGQAPVIRRVEWRDGPYIPWRITPRDLGQRILWGIQAWSSPARNRLLREVFRSVRLSPRESEVLCYTMEGHSLVWMAEKLGVTSKTVWTHRRRAMDLLGIRRLHELMQLPGGSFCDEKEVFM
ncbi:helix-turn-helix transcriptional regulator [Salmonella enterica]|uniref:Helix-turn-helix transcriptional regulator n=1 Tax=Salmonella enterica subsp. salamae TaxID=59202 RepID=A0A5Y1WLZ9_SALER|nr:LuxR family transcriptional regulator [Salmonella enterica]ECC1609038.1 helix-turn-helix transcriptional regulator [Salmonella enterica subsp. salamae]ECC1628728.1 helix-turn-helix transcriptional regulator [Salmonella enterica subsp. salamae]ECD9357534.1 helix-turn-helix transcriptional regulator [Salmonella enterica subsp. salamae]ECD9435366.1 helix-turn-helix transcriptional regulator [Salmonella enterica subsp. salamae]